MKTTLRKALPLLLCLIFCICLAPAAWAEETEEIILIEDYEPYSAADDSVTLAFELSDAEIFDAAGDVVTINFDANGGTGTMASQDFVRGDAAKPLNPNTFTREGYFFLGWNERADGTAGEGRIIKNGAEMRLSEASSASTLTLYAQWEERTTESDTVSVSFDANGGTGTMPPQDFVRGDVVKPLNPNTFTRDGYIFANWNTEADGSGTAYQNGAKIAPSENMTLYAQWTDKVLVHYDPNGASGSRKAQWFTLGVPKKLGSIEAVGYVMDGYEFVGWAPVSDAAPDDPRIIPSGSEFTAESETWLYAIWRQDLWWAVGFTLDEESNGAGMIRLMNGSTALTSNSNITDSNGNIIIKPNGTNAWLVHDGTETALTLAVTPASGNTAYIRLNDGEYNAFTGSQRFELGTVTGQMIHTVAFIRNSASPRPDIFLGLPASLRFIEDEAFAGGTFTYIRIPAETTVIGSRAFADCPNLKYVDIQGNTTEIAEDAFENADGLTIIGKFQSTAIAFAKAHGYSYYITG